MQSAPPKYMTNHNETWDGHWPPPPPRPELHIRQDTEVTHTYVVSGKCEGPVQVFVKSNDNLWYLQKKPVRHPFDRFKVECDFGHWDIDLESVYYIQAVQTAERPTSPMKELPSGAKSEMVKVWRVR